MDYDFPYILEISSSQLTNFMIFQRGRYTTNQCYIYSIHFLYKPINISCLGGTFLYRCMFRDMNMERFSRTGRNHPYDFCFMSLNESNMARWELQWEVLVGTFMYQWEVRIGYSFYGTNIWYGYTYIYIWIFYGTNIFYGKDHLISIYGLDMFPWIVHWSWVLPSFRNISNNASNGPLV